MNATFNDTKADSAQPHTSPCEGDPRLPAISAFAAIARGYCDWCEHKRKGRDPDRLAAQWLCRVNEGVLNLPKVTWRERLPDAPDLRSLPPRQGERATHLAMFGGYYRKVFDPDPQGTEEPVLGSVFDDLRGVYGDLSEGLQLYENGYPLHACRHWVDMYLVHWGLHATGALTALYFERVRRMR